ncbi:UDP-glycosyltransferase 71C4 [Triticum urartu]|uniref:UDP-glycosyltransferase 71C4 n=1 Tax=Triticum urartu TaxID=4572 RepID=M7ZUJ9_TRIUA|nr:UDP-glycosyltransferase 71C4 [Triticum urartu]
MESRAAGRPGLAWPQMAEQHLNAHHVTHIIGAGVRITAAGGVVGRAEVERKVRRLMDAGDADGQKMRAKAAWTQKAARSAVSDGGTSRVALLKLVEELQGSYCDVMVANKDRS